jgi:hypothetical protein
MSHVVRVTTAVAAALLLCGTALAQIAYDPEPELVPLAQVLGRSVQSVSGEPLGSIADLLLHPRTRKVEYLVLKGPEGSQAVYPIGALVAGKGNELLLDAAFGESSAAGGSFLAESPARSRQMSAAKAMRPGRELVVDLLEGTVRRQR